MKFKNPYVYLSISLTVLLLAIGLLPQFTSSAVSIEPAAEVPEVTIDETIDYGDEPIFKIVEQMPLWPGCEDKGPFEKRKKCADKKMLEYIYDNIEYPEEAREKEVQGMAVVSFVVEKDGRLTQTKIMRDPGAGTGVEVLRVVNNIQNDDIYWIPGRQKGKPVRVKFNLPVKFKLE